MSENRLRGEMIADAMSVDVEDYFHVEAFAKHVSFSDWPSFPSRVRQNTERILNLFAAYGCRGTFFVLGWVAEREPALIRRIVEAGHEVGCHSYSHRRVSTLTPDEFRADLKRAVAAIEDAAGVRVLGYRAPTFSIVKRSLWALEVLAECGFIYDSSIFPIRHDLYGFPEAPCHAHEVSLPGNKKIFEIPMSTVRLFGQNVPVGGGGYLRLLPMAYTVRALDHLHVRHKRPAIIYFHPWEIDPEQPKIAAGVRSRFRHYHGLEWMEKRLRVLLERSTYVPLIELLPQHSQAPLGPTQFAIPR